MKKQPQKPKRTCGMCIHEWACAAQICGNLHNTDAWNCVNFETVKSFCDRMACLGTMPTAKEKVLDLLVTYYQRETNPEREELLIELYHRVKEMT